MLDDGTAERGAMMGNLYRLVEASTHHAGGARAMRHAAEINHVHHLAEASVKRAELVGERALEHDFAAGHRARAQFVLEPGDPIVVALAVFQSTRHQEEPEPA